MEEPALLNRTLLLLSPVLLLALASACGGGGDGNAFDVDRADEIAHAAMLAPEDLPGGGWDLISEDDFGEDSDDGDESPFELDTPACREFSNRMEELQGRALGFFGEETGFDAAGKARREFERTAEFFPSTTEFEVEVYEDRERLEEAIRLMRDVLSDDQFGRCMSDVFAVGFEEGVDQDEQEFTFELEFEEVTPSAGVPGDDGVGKAFTVTINVEMPELDVEFALDIRMEFYFWRLSNAVVSVFIFGDPAQLTTEEIAAMVATQAERLEAAK